MTVEMQTVLRRVWFSNKLSDIAVTGTSSHFTRLSICANRGVRVTSFFRRTYLAVGIGVSITDNDACRGGNWPRHTTKRSIELCDTSAFSPAFRAFVRHDLVTIASNQGTRKERALFLFSDLLVITSIKRRSGTIRKPST